MKKILGILTVFVACFGFVSEVKASNIGLSSNKTNVNVGSTVTIRVSTNDLIGNFSVTSSNPSVLSGGTNGEWIENDTKLYTFTAKSTGTVRITVLAINVSDGNAQDFSGSKSITINVGNQEIIKKSSNNYLSTLEIEGQQLDNPFTKDNLAYISNVEAGIDKINIKATLEDNKASIKGDGEINVQEGENKIDIVVTAEDGTTRVYTLTVNVKEFNPIVVKINGKKYTVVRNKKNIISPVNYEETTIKINKEEVPAYKSKITGYTLIALKDEKGTQNFYIYKDKKFTLYKEYTFNKIMLCPLKLNKIPSGYFKTSITFNNGKINAYKLKENSKYALIYAMNVETGEKHIYMYDSKEDTVQIYNREELDEKLNIYKIIIASLSGVTFISISIVLIIIINNHKKNHIKTKKIDSKIEDIKVQKVV